MTKLYGLSCVCSSFKNKTNHEIPCQTQIAIRRCEGRNRMDKMDYFMELYGYLPRGGPGDIDSTKKAYAMIRDIPPQPRILDIGCGPGVQTLELARLSGGKLLAIEETISA